MAEIIGDLVEQIHALPNGRERSLAMTKLEEAQMWYTAALAVPEKEPIKMCSHCRGKGFQWIKGFNGVSHQEKCLSCHGSGSECSACAVR